jgi:hypothetical protein
VDLSQAVKLKFINGLTDPEIGRLQGVTKQAINQALEPFKVLMSDNNTLKTFEDNYDRILTHVNMQLMSAILDPVKIKKASLNNVAYAFTQINQALRLHRGESTATIDVHNSTTQLKDLEAKRQELLDQKRQIVDVTPTKATSK